MGTIQLNGVLVELCVKNHVNPHSIHKLARAVFLREDGLPAAAFIVRWLAIIAFRVRAVDWRPTLCIDEWNTAKRCVLNCVYFAAICRYMQCYICRWTLFSQFRRMTSTPGSIPFVSVHCAV